MSVGPLPFDDAAVLFFRARDSAKEHAIAEARAPAHQLNVTPLTRVAEELKRISATEKGALESLLGPSMLNGNPLATEAAGAYVGNVGIGFDEYLDRITRTKTSGTDFVSGPDTHRESQDSMAIDGGGGDGVVLTPVDAAWALVLSAMPPGLSAAVKTVSLLCRGRVPHEVGRFRKISGSGFAVRGFQTQWNAHR